MVMMKEIAIAHTGTTMAHATNPAPPPQLSADGKLLSVHVPIAFRKRGGRKVVIAPGGMPTSPQHWAGPRQRVDTTLQRALVRAFRWQRMLDQGTYATVSELAKAERLDISYVSHTIRLTLLAPDIVEAILDGTQPATMQLQPLMRGFPLEWERQG